MYYKGRNMLVKLKFIFGNLRFCLGQYVSICIVELLLNVK